MAKATINGTELFYTSRDHQLMAVPVRVTGSKLETGDPKALFELKREGLAISRDGSRFLAVVPVEEESRPVTVALNWKMEKK